MNDYIIRESNHIEADFIVDKIVEYNLSIFPSKQETKFFELNLKHGYEVFGVLDECPEGHERYFLKKTLF